MPISTATIPKVFTSHLSPRYGEFAVASGELQWISRAASYSSSRWITRRKPMAADFHGTPSRA